MSAATDKGVLAVMSDAACDFQHEHGDFANSEKMRLAHATVAELIEASRFAAEKLHGMAREFSSPRFVDRYGDGHEMRERADALFAALARCNGGVA